VWHAIHARATGTSHVASGMPCQDREAYRLVDNADGGEAAIGIVCDGAGSALYSDLGAEIVSTTLRSTAAAFLSQYGSSAISAVDLREWIVDIREQVGRHATAQDAETRDYACTLLFILACDEHTICGQIGDGAIIVKDQSDLHVPIWPDNGEYANQTFFITHDDSEARLHVAKIGPITDFVVFSDGLQRIALDDAGKRAHPAFINPLIATVRASDALETTQAELERFLQSQRINARTDDDKSIVIACRIQ